MKEIKLIVSQEKLEQNRRNEILKEKTKENYKKQERMNKIVREFIVTGSLIIAMLWIGHIGMNIKDTGIKGCMENGYSESYCIAHS